MGFIHIASGTYHPTEASVRAAEAGALIPTPFCRPDGYAEVEVDAYPSFDPLTEAVESLPPELDGGVWRQHFSKTALSAQDAQQKLAQRKADLKAQATARRWQVETGGLTLPSGAAVGTAVDDQNRITAVIANATLAGVESLDFKAQTGWVTLTVAEIAGIAAAIALHVQACFSAERAHHEAIDALATAAQAAAYQVDAGWPGGAA